MKLGSVKNQAKSELLMKCKDDPFLGDILLSPMTISAKGQHRINWYGSLLDTNKNVNCFIH
ncbi:MAG: hypothetical protein U0T84_05085 [Chitinophagales bacterium]